METNADKIRKLSGEKQLELEKIKQAVVKGMNFKTPNLSDLDRFSNEIRMKVQWVENHARQINTLTEGIRGLDDRRLLMDEVRNKYRDVFECYDKDELLFILANYFTTVTMGEI